MATSAFYRLLPMAQRTKTLDGEAFHTVGRRSWQLSLFLMRLASGGSAQVIVEQSPVGGDASDWKLLDFTNLLEAALTTSPIVKDVEVSPGEFWLRGRVTANVGTFTLRLMAASPFLNSGDPDDLIQLPQQVREYDEGLGRIIDAAEDDILQRLGRDLEGRLQLRGLEFARFPEIVSITAEEARLGGDLLPLQALDHIRQAIARQATHLFQKDQLTRSKEPGAAAAIREMGRYHRDIEELLLPIIEREKALQIWGGR